MVTQIGLNETALSNIPAPTITINQTASGILNQIPDFANSITLGYLPHISLFGLLILLWWILSEDSPVAPFKYSPIRAFSIATGLVAVMGLVMLQINYIQSFRIVAMMVIMFIISNILLARQENR